MLEKFFVSKVRIKLLKLFLSNPKKSYHVRGITRLLDEEINAVRRELGRMEKVKFVTSTRKGNRLLYSVRRDFPYYDEFLSLVNKAFGLGSLITSNSEKIGQIEYAWLTKFYTKNQNKGDQDVDLVIIGDNLDYEKLASIIKKAEAETEKQVNYTVMGSGEFDLRKKRNDSFLANLLNSSKVMLIGDEDELLD